jgi:enoyl-CoA hydratase/carnithine racemase
LALTCHYRIATPSAVLALPESIFGLMPGCGGTIRLMQLVGIAPAIDIILTGRSLLAEQAKQIGIVDLVVERSRLLDTAEQLILKLNRTDNRKNNEHPPG